MAEWCNKALLNACPRAPAALHVAAAYTGRAACCTFACASTYASSARAGGSCSWFLPRRVGPLPILHCEPQAHCFALGPLSNATRGVFRSFKREGWSSKTRAGFRSLEEVHRHLVVNAEQHPASPLAGPYVGQPSARSSEHRLRKSALFSAESGPASLPFLYVRSVSPYDAYEEYGHLLKVGALALDAQGRIYPMNYNHTQCSPLSGHSSMLLHSSVLTIGLSATCELQLARILYSSGSTTQSV